AAGAVLTLAPSSATAASSGAVAVTPTATWGTDGKVYSMTKVDNTIYLAGTFNNLVNPKTGKKQPAANIGAIDATTGKPITTFTAGTNGLIYSVKASADGSTLYVGGIFTAADGVARKNLAAFSTSTGAVTAWAPKATVDVRAVLPIGDKVIVGGDF